MKKAVTIKSIAEKLNLSRNTVAKALNGHYVPEKTRELVLKKAKEMNYKSINIDTTEFDGNKYKILLVSGKPLNNIRYFIPFVGAIQNYCFEKKYELFEYIFNNTYKPFAELSDHVKSLGIDGIIMVECFDKDLIAKTLSLKKPVIFTDFISSHIQSPVNYDMISANDVQASSEIVGLLIKKYGISRFTFVGDINHCKSFNNRYTGMLIQLLRTKIYHNFYEDILCDDNAFNYGNPEDLKTEILKLKHIPECFICCNDFVARSVCDALKLLNLNVPKDAFVVGFDNVQDAYLFSPKITSCFVDKKVLGLETIRTLVHRIENMDKPTKDIAISSKIIIRESTIR